MHTEHTKHAPYANQGVVTLEQKQAKYERTETVGNKLSITPKMQSIVN
jgi:hypothetical protein